MNQEREGRKGSVVDTIHHIESWDSLANQPHAYMHAYTLARVHIRKRKVTGHFVFRL